MTDTEKSVKIQSKEAVFQGKHFVITGGASGIGYALVKHLQDLGATVTVIDVNAPKPTDVTDPKSLEQAFAEIGKIDTLVLAAGVTSETEDPTDEEIALMDAVNVDGIRNTLTVAQPYLNIDAQIVYIGSDDPPKAHYAETKAQGAEMVREFARRHPDLDTRVLLLGPVRTPLFEKGKSPERIEDIAHNVGLYKPGELATEITDALTARQKGLSETVMYKSTES